MYIIEASYNLKQKFDLFNKKFFDSSLNPINLTVEKLGTDIAGQFFPSKDKSWRIAVDPRYTDEAYMDAILIHEMIHYWMFQNGLQKAKGTYHGKIFKDKVDEINRKSNNKYHVGYTNTLYQASQESDKKEVYALMAFPTKVISTYLHKPIVWFTEDNFNPTFLKKCMSILYDKTDSFYHYEKNDFVYIIKVVVGNEYIPLKYIKLNYISKYEDTNDKLLVKLMKQSKQYKIIGKYNFDTEQFEKV